MIIAVLVCPASHSATSEIEESKAKADSTLYRLKAGHLRYRVENDNQIVYLSGGVRIDHQTITITSLSGRDYVDEKRVVLLNEVHASDSTMEIFGDKGEYFKVQKVLFMKENVRCLDEGMEILCDRGRYDREDKEALLTGNVKLSDSTRVLYADTVYYNRVTETADAFGKVVLVNLAEDYAVAGAHARYQRKKQRIVMDTAPILTFDQSKKTPGRIKSKKLQFDLDKNIGMAVGGVILIKGDTRATCDSAVLFNDEKYVELRGEPEATSGPSSMSGRTIELWYDGREVNRIVLPKKGRLAEAPPRGSHWWKDSWVEGDSVIIHLSEENVDSVKMFGNAKAMYYPAESENNKVSDNYSTGDSIFFKFEDDDLTYVRISGNANGLYKYLRIENNETIDSLAAKMDTVLKYRDFDVESKRVKYSGVNIEYFAKTEDIKLDKKASLCYENKILTADHIDFNSKMNILKAEGDPVLEEDKQKMYGYEMGYDMEGSGGIVVDGSTKYDKGYYRGKHIFKDGEDILKVYDSIYTTCDLKKPHYSLRANKMKVYVGDKVVSGPIKLYIGEIPIFYLPFMANSIRHDRHSGILRPNFDIGMNSRDGRFIRGLGYYWATNDYTDFNVRTDFNEYQNFRIRLDNRYKIRYMLNGNVRLNFMRDFQNKTGEWTVNSSHSQSFGKTASFRSNLRFVSSDQAQSALHRAEDVKKIVDRRIYSSASFNKSWGGTKLGLSASRNQKLNVSSPNTSRVSGTMPSLSLNFPRISLWFGGKHDGSESIPERMLKSISFSPNISAKRMTEESKAKKSTRVSASSGASFSQQHKLLFLNFSPSLSTRWNYSDVSYYDIDTSLVDPSSFVNESSNKFTMNLNAGMGTTLYGTFYPKIGSIRGIRHTFNPSASYSYTPKLGKEQIERRFVRYSIRNILDLKVLENEELVKKNNVITWNLSGSYNPDVAKDNRLSNISSSVRTSIGNLMSFSLNQSIDPREKEIVSTSFSTDLSLGGAFSYPAEWRLRKAEKIAAAGTDSSESKDEKSHPEGSAGGQRRWSLNIGYSYSSRGIGEYKSISSKVDLRGNLKLTEGWEISYSGYYDLERQEFTNQQYSLKRDLHCWQASFIHRKFGGEWSYYFQISIKELPDIMYERGKRGIRNSMPFM
jgi:lipopolysaccharide assembly outer membrane protein LptD (OstA)